METDTPIGFLQGGGGISSEIMDILHAAGRDHDGGVIFSDDPDQLISELTAILDRDHIRYKSLYE